MASCKAQTKSESVTVQSQSFNTEMKKIPRRRSVIIPSLNLNGDTRESPRRRIITSPHSARNIIYDEIIPLGSMVLTPHTPPGDDNPCDILNDKILQNIKKRRSGQQN